MMTQRRRPVNRRWNQSYAEPQQVRGPFPFGVPSIQIPSCIILSANRSGATSYAPARIRVLKSATISSRTSGHQRISSFALSSLIDLAGRAILPSASDTPPCLEYVRKSRKPYPWKAFGLPRGQTGGHLRRSEQLCRVLAQESGLHPCGRRD